MNPAQTRTVLAVDDEEHLVELYAAWLRDEYTVRTATGGQEALRQLDESIDVVLLDRQMPDLTGDEVLTAIRDQGFDCRVAMVTGVEPDFDIIQMGFDDYAVKPMDGDELHNLVGSLIQRSTYDTKMQEYFALVSKRAVLEAEMDETDRTTNPAFAVLEARIAKLRDEVDELASHMDVSEFEAALHNLDQDPSQLDSVGRLTVSTSMDDQSERGISD